MLYLNIHDISVKIHKTRYSFNRAYLLSYLKIKIKVGSIPSGETNQIRLRLQFPDGLEVELLA